MMFIHNIEVETEEGDLSATAISLRKLVTRAADGGAGFIYYKIFKSKRGFKVGNWEHLRLHNYTEYEGQFFRGFVREKFNLLRFSVTLIQRYNYNVMYTAIESENEACSYHFG